MANPNISLLGATYSAVAGVTLPTQGGGTATFPWVEGSQTITQNGTVDVTSLEEVVVSVSGGGGVTVTDEPNATGITCVITSGSGPTPVETWETVHDGNIQWNHDDNADYPYCWISDLSSVQIPSGSVWRLTYSGNQYRCTAAYDSGQGTVVIGNPKWGGGNDDGSDVPMCFSNQGWGAWTGNLDVPNVSSTYAVKIERLMTE